MKNVLSIVATLFVGLALATTPACGKKKKEPAKPEQPTADTEPKADDKPVDDKPAAGGW